VNVTAILEDLRREGVKVWSEGEELRYRGPSKALTPDVLNELRSRKQEVIRILRGRSTTLTTLSAGGEGTTPLRPYAVNAVNRCIHETEPERCAVCNGYARWLIAGGDARIDKARHNTEAARRRYWREVRGAS
jgi:TubC N-terminal docking domain